jgi:uncharacterized protein YjeT (DUF2065 family)
MPDVISGIRLFLIIEGLAYVLALRAIEQLLSYLSTFPIPSSRLFGAMTALIGALLLWLVKVFT